MPDAPRPLVTVGIAAFNAAHSIETAVATAFAQTWRPLEVVVVDDCSTDDTPERLGRLQAVHPELRVVRMQRNGGIGQVRNRILDEARGEFVAFFDDDDRSDPDRVKLQLQRIVEYERRFAAGAPVICHSARRVLYPDGTTRLEGTIGESEDRKAPAGEAVAKRILLGRSLADGNGACPTCSQMGRLQTYRRLGGFDDRFRRSEDTDFNVRLALAGGHFVGMARPLVTQVMTRTSDKGIADEHRSFAALLEKHRAFVGRHGEYEFCRKWLDAKYAWLARRWGECVPAMLALALRHPLATARRLAAALPNVGLNRAFARFHRGPGSGGADTHERQHEALTALMLPASADGTPGRVTIGITCFNAVETIRRAIDSALAQDWADLEVVIVDDCSADGSADLVHRLVGDRPGVRFIRHEVNRGAAAARNTILAAATGEYLAWFDDDDVSAPDRVRTQVRVLEEYERSRGTRLVACYASGRRVYPNGYQLSLPAIGSRPQVPHGAVVADYLLFNQRMRGVFYGAGTPTCALLSRTATLRAVGGFDAALRRAEDLDLAVRLAIAGGHFIGCERELFTQHATIAADKAPLANRVAELQLVDKHAAYLRARGRHDYAQRWFEIRYLHFSGERRRFFAALLAFLARYPLSGLGHLLRSGPARRSHESGMTRIPASTDGDSA